MHISSFTASLVLFASLTTLGCSDSSNGSEPGNGNDNDCLASAMELTQTDLTDDTTGSQILLSFDVKNTSSTDYDVQAGSTPINLNFKVVTTDGTEYESVAPLTATKISAGGTGTAIAMAEYGANKTYQSYTVEKSCR